MSELSFVSHLLPTRPPSIAILASTVIELTDGPVFPDANERPGCIYYQGYISTPTELRRADTRKIKVAFENCAKHEGETKEDGQLVGVVGSAIEISGHLVLKRNSTGEGALKKITYNIRSTPELISHKFEHTGNEPIIGIVLCSFAARVISQSQLVQDGKAEPNGYLLLVFLVGVGSAVKAKLYIYGASAKINLRLSKDSLVQVNAKFNGIMEDPEGKEDDIPTFLVVGLVEIPPTRPTVDRPRRNLPVPPNMTLGAAADFKGKEKEVPTKKRSSEASTSAPAVVTTKKARGNADPVRPSAHPRKSVSGGDASASRTQSSSKAAVKMEPSDQQISTTLSSKVSQPSPSTSTQIKQEPTYNSDDMEFKSKKNVTRLQRQTSTALSLALADVNVEDEYDSDDLDLDDAERHEIAADPDADLDDEADPRYRV